jgi:glycosyltransferase involved in cell wall biosynthesis
VPRLSVVIPTVGRPTLARVLERLRAPGVEVIVVADANAGPLPDATLRATEPGAAGARNAGWRASRADVVLFTDDDVLAAPDLIERHLALHEHPDERIGGLGHVRWADALRPTPLMEWLDDGVLFDYGRIEGTEAGWWHFYTANVSVKRSLLERAGGFDAQRFPYLYEDLDLAYRLSKEHGFRLRYDSGARAEHMVPPTLEHWRKRMPTLAKAERAFVARHPELPPYFHDRFEAIAAEPPAHGITGQMQPLIPLATPWLGPRAWVSAKQRTARELARAYLDAW